MADRMAELFAFADEIGVLPAEVRVSADRMAEMLKEMASLRRWLGPIEPPSINDFSFAHVAYRGVPIVLDPKMRPGEFEFVNPTPIASGA